MKQANSNLIVGLDIGTSKVVAMMAEIQPDSTLKVIGVGAQDSKGLKKGVVVNIEETVRTVSQVIQEVELMADRKVENVYTGIAGGHIHSFNSDGMVAIKNREVTEADIERVMETAKAMPISAEQEIIHTLIQEYVIDGQDGIRDPLGMSGMRLEAKIHIVTGAISAVQNIVKCIRRSGLEVSDIVLQPLASSFAILSDDERELGVCLVDIGGGTTDVAVWTHGAIRHSAVIPIAGDQVTNDIAMALRTSTKEAENIKCRYGYALASLVDEEEEIEVAGVDDRPNRRLKRQTLAEVIQPRIEELYELIARELHLSGYQHILSSGIVLTGGASVIPGMVELGEEFFHCPVRLGTPRYQGSLADVVKNPRFSTVYGLLLEGKQRVWRQFQQDDGTEELAVIPQQSIEEPGVLTKMKSWFERNF